MVTTLSGEELIPNVKTGTWLAVHGLAAPRTEFPVDLGTMSKIRPATTSIFAPATANGVSAFINAAIATALIMGYQNALRRRLRVLAW